jgi:hypothetical protein
MSKGKHLLNDVTAFVSLYSKDQDNLCLNFAKNIIAK